MNVVISEINDFYSDVVPHPQIRDLHDSNILNDTIVKGICRVIDKPLGYMDHYYSVSRGKESATEDIYAVQTISVFIPGSVASSRNILGYDQGARNVFGYLHAIVLQDAIVMSENTFYKCGLSHQVSNLLTLPTLSFQRGSSSESECQWSYYYEYPACDSNQIGYIYLLEGTGSNSESANIKELQVKLSFRMNIEIWTKKLFWSQKKMQDPTDYECTIDIL